MNQHFRAFDPDHVLKIQHDIGIFLGQTSDLNSGLNHLLEKASRLNGIDCGGVYLVDQQSGELNLEAQLELSEEFINENKHFSSESAQADSLNKCTPYYLTNKDILARNNPLYVGEGLRSCAVIPILHHGKAVASLNLASRSCDEIPPETKLALVSIASNLGGAILRIRAENQMMENEEKYRQFFENITQGFASHEIILDDSGNPLDYRYLAVNPTFEKMTGLKAADVVGKTVFELLPKTEKYWIELYGNVALTGKPVQYENYSGELHKYFEVTAFCPRIGQFATVFSDITKRRRDEEIWDVMYAISNSTSTNNDLETQLRLIRQELGKLIDVTNFFIAMCDEPSDTLSIPFFRDQKDDLSTIPKGKSLTSYVIKTKKPLLCRQADFEKLASEGLVEQIGSPAKVWLGLPLLIKGEPIGAFVLQSYDDEKAYTEDDLSMLEFVSHQISEAIQQKKTEQELKMALEKAEESDRLKTAFLANMSHELRTPLNGMMGFAELLDDDSLSLDERHEFISVINDSGQSLLDVITNIVDISKIDSRQISSKKTAFNLNRLLEELMNWFSNEKIVINKPHLTIEIAKGLADGQSMIVSDSIKIKHVFSLLLKNAAKFTNEGFIRFGYTVNEQHIRFFVQDTGKGIRPENRNSVFERFRQEEESLSRKYGGLGLGLTIAKGLVELMDGEIGVESELGKGSTFWFKIPVKE